MESSFFLQSNTHHSLFHSSKPSSPFYSTHLLTRTAQKQRSLKPIMAFLPQENSNHANICKRKSTLFMGFEGFPILRMSSIKARASKGFIMQTSQVNFFSLLNGLGIFGAVVLGVLYALALKEKAESEATLESMRNKVKDKDTEILSMEKRFEMELLNLKGICSKQLKEANEEKLSLIDQLTSANRIITKMGQELQQNKRSANELTAQIHSLEHNINMAEQDKFELQGKLKEKLDSLELLQGSISLLEVEINNKEHNIEKLGTALKEQEREFSSLTLSYEQSHDQVRVLESDMEKLNDELQKYKIELEMKNAAVVNLNAQVMSLLAERDEMSKELDAIHSQYNDLKHFSAEKEASDAKLLEERQENLNMLKRFVIDLTHERDDLEKSLADERKKVKVLEEGLQNKDVSLKKLKEEASNKEKQLQRLRELCSERELELCKVRAEFTEERESFERNLVEARESEDIVIRELASTRGLLNEKDDELQMRSHELATLAEIRNSLEKELADANEKAEKVINALKEEKENAASQNNELKELESHVSKDLEERKFLEADLAKATQSLDEMNQKTISLSRSLEHASSRILTLEEENNVLQRTLVEQRQISQEARANLDGAHAILMRLKKERESLEKKAQTLEDELASAKGDMLLLSHQINSLEIPVNTQHSKSVESEGDETVVPVKKTTTRRRKVSTPREHS